MRLLREALLCFFVIAIVLYLYSVAASVALFSLCGFVPHRDKPAAVHHSKIAPTAHSISLRT
jgi:hypothetical protein